MEPVVLCIIFLAAVAIFIVNIIMAEKMADAVEAKGHDAASMHIMALCFWLPFFGYLYAIALPDIRAQRQNTEIIEILCEISNALANSNHGEHYNDKSETNDRLPVL